MSGSTLGGKVLVLIGPVDVVVLGVETTLVDETVLMSVVLTGLPALGSLGSKKPGGGAVGEGSQ